MLNILFDDFSTLLTEVYVRVVADNVGSAQCVDLAQLWNRVIGGPRFTGDAHTIYSQSGTFYTQTPNTPTGVPPKGAIVVWSPAFNGGPGHVAVATGEGDINKFKALEQNDTTGGTDSSVQVKTYDYTDVMGWLVPNQQPENQQAIIDQLRTARDNNYNLYQADEQKIKDIITQSQTLQQGLQQQITSLQQQLTNCQNTKVVNPVQIPVTVTTSSPNSNSSTLGTTSESATSTVEIPIPVTQTSTSEPSQKQSFTLGWLIGWIKNTLQKWF